MKNKRHMLAAIEGARAESGIPNVQAAERVERWSMIDWGDYRRHQRFWKRFGGVTVTVLEPEYFALTKLTRASATDLADIRAVFRKHRASWRVLARAAGRALQDGDAVRVHEALWEALASYFGHRLNLLPGQISRDAVTERLSRSGLDPGLWRATLERYGFLRVLSPEEHERLRERVLLFLHDKSMHGARGLVLREDMRVAIAAQACILILNLDIEFYRGWVDIIVYPDEFVAEYEYTDEDGVVHKADSGVDHTFSQGSALGGLVAWYEDSGDPAVRQDFGRRDEPQAGVAQVRGRSRPGLLRCRRCSLLRRIGLRGLCGGVLLRTAVAVAAVLLVARTLVAEIGDAVVADPLVPQRVRHDPPLESEHLRDGPDQLEVARLPGQRVVLERGQLGGEVEEPVDRVGVHLDGRQLPGPVTRPGGRADVREPLDGGRRPLRAPPQPRVVGGVQVLDLGGPGLDGPVGDLQEVLGQRRVGLDVRLVRGRHGVIRRAICRPIRRIDGARREGNNGRDGRAHEQHGGHRLRQWTPVRKVFGPPAMIARRTESRFAPRLLGDFQ